MNAAGTRPSHLSGFHLPDLYAARLDGRVGEAVLGSLDAGVETGVSVPALRNSTSFSSCRRTCAVLGPYMLSWK